MLAWNPGFIGARFSIDYAPALLVVTLLLLPFVYRPLLKAPFLVLLRNAGIGLLAMAGYMTGVTQGIALGVPAGLVVLCADLLRICARLHTGCPLFLCLNPATWQVIIYQPRTDKPSLPEISGFTGCWLKAYGRAAMKSD